MHGPNYKIIKEDYALTVMKNLTKIKKKSKSSINFQLTLHNQSEHVECGV